MKKIYYHIISALAAAAVLFACTPSEEALPEGTFRVEDEYLSLDFTQDAQYIFVPVVSNISEASWEVTSSASWCIAGTSLSGSRGLMISVAENQEMEARTAKVFVKAQENSVTLTVVQLGYGPAIIVRDAYVDPAGGKIDVSVTSNIPYEVGDPILDSEDIEEGEDAWLTRSSLTKSMATVTYSFDVLPNFTAGKRYAGIPVTAVDRSLKEVDDTIRITQSIYEDNSSTDVIGGTEKFAILSAKAVKGENEEYYSKVEVLQTGSGSPDLLFDGDVETYFHSPRYPAQELADQYKEYGTELPFTIEFEMADEGKADYMVLSHTGSSGRVKKFAVYTKETASSEPVLCGTFSCSSSGTDKEMFYFDQTISNSKYIILEIQEAYESSNRIRIAEVEFYATNKADVEEWILKVFTDLSCTELKGGVTKKLINQMAAVVPYIAKNVAMPLYQETYDEKEFEFRAHSYEAYSNPQTAKQKYNVRLYTELDNPTGILVKNGESVVVCVDRIPEGHTVKFAVNGDQSSGNEFNYSTSQFSQTLKPGVNIVPVSLSGIEEGLVFIIHTDSDLKPSSQPVKVHILPGTCSVVGYFDLSRHDDARFKEMLAANPYKYFVQKGSRTVVVFHTSALRKPATAGGMSSGLGFMDQLVEWEWDLMGLNGQTDFNNHIMIISSEAENAYMDASDRRVRLGASTVSNYATAEMMKDNGGAGPWGLAHEIGHVNQPAICWESTIESSNNLFSNYCIYKSGVTESRGHSLISLANSYGLPWYKLGNTGQYQNEDAELHLRMNWQLWNYFHRCLGDEDFWPRVFAEARKNPAPGMYYSLFGYSKEDPGTCQLMFYEHVCDAAKMDLTEFFDTWGFFREVSDTYGQYQSGILYSVSSAMISESKARVAAKNYPKAPAIQDLEDRTRSTRSNSDPGYNKDIRMGYYTTFKDQVNMTTVPKYTLSGRNVTITDYSQAVAVEVYRKSDGQMLYFSNLSEFTLPAKTGGGETIDTGNIEFKAVQWDGVRKAM